MSDRKYTKGDCYAICEFLDELTNHNHDMISDICDELGYDFGRMCDLLCRLSSDVDSVICDEQDERDYTEQMAEIMQIVHIPGHDD